MLSEDQVEAVFQRLCETMPGRTPDAKGPKDQPDPFRSAVSCILSAQSRDQRTAAATSALFALATTPEEMLALDEATIAGAIKPCGLYNSKARNLRAFSAALLDQFGGVVPRTRGELMSLPGIGRKCADIVMSFTFGEDVIAVDTHVHRVCNRIGLTAAGTAEQTAMQLERRAPAWALHDGHFWLIQHGKLICHARAPKCDICPVSDLCEYYAARPAARS